MPRVALRASDVPHPSAHPSPVRGHLGTCCHDGTPCRITQIRLPTVLTLQDVDELLSTEVHPGEALSHRLEPCHHCAVATSNGKVRVQRALLEHLPSPHAVDERSRDAHERRLAIAIEAHELWLLADNIGFLQNATLFGVGQLFEGTLAR